VNTTPYNQALDYAQTQTISRMDQKVVYSAAPAAWLLKLVLYQELTVAGV